MAPIQVVGVPIFRTDEEQGAVMEALTQVMDELRTAGVRVHLDDREGLTPGFKYNDWEMRGVPIRLELGPKDLEKGSVALARRDIPGRDGKSFVPRDEVVSQVKTLLEAIHENMLRQATEFRDANLHRVESYDALKETVQNGWALIWHCGTKVCEDNIKEETKASSRCFPLDLNEKEPAQGHTCTVCGEPAQGLAYFARAY
jgi:prolyl-tRNA synthetase